MSILSCLLKKAEAGRISKSVVKDLSGYIDRLKTKGGVAGELEAAQFAYEMANKRVAQKVKQASIHVDLVEKAISKIDADREAGVSTTASLRSFNFGDDADNFKYGYLGENAAETISGYQGFFKTQAIEAFDALKHKGIFGVFRDNGKSKEMIRDLFEIAAGRPPKSTDPLVVAGAKAIEDLHMLGGKMYERAGGNITLKKGHALGDHAAPEKLDAAGFDNWLKDAKQVFNRDKIAEWIPEAGFKDDVYEDILKRVYIAKVSGGNSQLGDYVPKGLRSAVNLRNHHRFMEFNNADDYIRYHETYGDLNLYQHTLNYADQVGRDIGSLESYGPKPEAYINSIVRHIASYDPKGSEEARNILEQQMRFNTKSYNGSVDPTISRWIGTARNANVMGKLGGTVIEAAITEGLGLSRISQKVRGLPILKTMRDELELIGKHLAANFGNESKDLAYKELAKLGIYTEGFIDEMAAGLRAYSAEGGHKFSQTAAQGVMKYTGLNAKTHAGKAASAKRYAIEIADHTWEELQAGEAPGGMKEYLTSLGFTKELYDTIRTHGTVASKEWSGINMISSAKLFEEGHTEAGLAMSKVFNRIAEASAPTSSPRANALFEKMSRTGPLGQVGSGMLRTFTGYPLSFWDNHIRVMMQTPGLGNKAAMLTAYASVFSVLGSMTVMINDLRNGKTPKLDEDTIMRSFGRAGLVPMLSDFIIGGQHYGKSLGDSILGPTFGAASELAGSASDLLHGKPSSAAHRATKVLKGFLPGQNHWAAGLLVQRLMFDQLRYLYDPEAHKKFKRDIKKKEREGTPYWWEPGQTSPN